MKKSEALEKTSGQKACQAIVDILEISSAFDFKAQFAIAFSILSIIEENRKSVFEVEEIIR